MKWEIQIGGDPHDLRELCRSFSTDAFRIFQRGEHHFLESSIFEAMTSHSDVESKARTVLQLLSGAADLELRGRTPLVVAHIAYMSPDGKRTVWTMMREVAHMRAFVSGQITKTDGSVEIHNPADRVPDWLFLALEDDNVAKVLRQLSNGAQNWVELYRIYEVIESDVGGAEAMTSRNWASKHQTRLFKWTANNPKAAGDSARHGFSNDDPPPVPMHVTEARILVEGIASSWLQEKQSQQLRKRP